VTLRPITTRFPFVATINGQKYSVDLVDGRIVLTPEHEA
jgi:hypothetical protein